MSSLVPRLLPRKTGKESGRTDHMPHVTYTMCGFDNQIIAHAFPTHDVSATLSLVFWVSLRLQIDTQRLFHYYPARLKLPVSIATTVVPSSTLPRHYRIAPNFRGTLFS